MEAKCCIQIQGSAFVFSRAGEGAEVRFKTLREAIKYAQALPQARGSKLVVLSESGAAAITLQL